MTGWSPQAPQSTWHAFVCQGTPGRGFTCGATQGKVAAVHARVPALEARLAELQAELARLLDRHQALTEALPWARQLVRASLYAMPCAGLRHLLLCAWEPPSALAY